MMAKALLIAEKPSLMKDIQAVYNKISFPDQIDFKTFRGHTVTLCSPDEYEPSWVDWKLETLPMIPKKFKYKPTADKLKLFQDLKQTIENGNYDYLINACDPGREGQHIFHSFYETLGCKLPVKRFWHRDLTATELERALRNLRDDLGEPALYNMTTASKLRASFDWLIGMNFSRAFSLMSGGNIPVGRVMTPVLRIIVDRELELQDFKARDFWELEADFGSYKGIYFNPTNDNETRFFSKTKATELAEQVINQTGVIESLDKKRDIKHAPRLHSLAEIQNEANKVYGFTMSETLAIVQELYEAKIVSYPRTDSSYITEAIAKTFPQMLKPLEGIPSLTPYIRSILGNPSVINAKMKDKKYVDNKKVSDHYAITPTGKAFDFAKLPKQQQQILELIAKRLVAIFLPPIIVNKTSVVTNIKGFLFKTNGSMLEDKGYSVLYGKTFNDNSLPLLNLKEAHPVEKTMLLSKQTTPPARYTDETLNKAMQNAGRFVEDEELKEVLKTSDGIGTPATRGAIVEKLVERKMLERRKKAFYATDYGINLIRGIGNHTVSSPELTGIWEGKLIKIEACELKPMDYYTEMIEYINNSTTEIKQMTISMSRPSKLKAIGTCPICGKTIGVSDKYYICQDYKPTNERTPSDCSFIVSKKTLGASITETDIKAILSNKDSKEKTVTFKDKNTQSEQKAKGVFYFEPTTNQVKFRSSTQKRIDPNAPKVEPKVIGSCPICGKSVLTGQKYFLCEGYKPANGRQPDDCSFILNRETYGATITEKDVVKILTGEQTEDKSFTFKEGKTGIGRLYFEQTENRIRIAFPDKAKTDAPATVLGVCPTCGGKVLDGKYYRCENYKKSCKFLLSKTICQAPITPEDLRLLLSGRTTEPKPMIFNNGRPGIAALYLEKGALKFKFK